MASRNRDLSSALDQDYDDIKSWLLSREKGKVPQELATKANRNTGLFSEYQNFLLTVFPSETFRVPILLEVQC